MTDDVTRYIFFTEYTCFGQCTEIQSSTIGRSQNQNNTCLYQTQLCPLYIQLVIKLCAGSVPKKHIIFLALCVSISEEVYTNQSVID